ncbi:MAG TPA: hypothetical protein VHV32_19045 [Candidatus Angelobacter sp.]|jgi:hypothetical protein|nr:hypothetical protein [Candidatus Angelobacter sp.]
MWVKRDDWDKLCEHVRSLESSMQLTRMEIESLQKGVYIPAEHRGIYGSDPGSYVSFSDAIRRIAEKIGVRFVKVQETPARIELQPLPKPIKVKLE